MTLEVKKAHVKPHPKGFFLDDVYGLVWYDDFGQALVNVHSNLTCQAPCAIHSPTDHKMKDFKQLYRFDRGIMERICPHGIGHPDPDDWAVRNGKDDGTHGCDGCCR